LEHFFRHEFGRLGAVLTRSLGVRYADRRGHTQTGAPKYADTQSA
jgi:hypothetical protein